MWRRRRHRDEPVAERPETPDGLLRRLHWTVLRPLAAFLGGDEPSLIRGPGLELAEIREYQPGDDVRHIDWNATARADRPYIREAHVERALDAWLVVDVSASIDWGTARCLKRDRAVDLATVAGQLLGRHGNRIGALLFAERPRGVIPPGAGRLHLLRIVARLREEPRQAGRGPTDLTAALVQARVGARRRSFVLVISDFLVANGWQDALSALARRHEVVAVRLRDPREGELPDVGTIAFEDPETGEQLVVDTGSRGLRERYRRAAEAQAERIHADLTRCGVDALVISTDEDLLPPLVRFLQARRRRRGVRGPSNGLAGQTSPASDATGPDRSTTAERDSAAASAARHHAA